MLLDDKALTKEQRELGKKTDDFLRESRYFSLRADPTRLKILHLLKHHQELCVTDLATILNLTISAVSHQLSLLERAGDVQKSKRGKIVCYSLSEQRGNGTP